MTALLVMLKDVTAQLDLCLMGPLNNENKSRLTFLLATIEVLKHLFEDYQVELSEEKMSDHIGIIRKLLVELVTVIYQLRMGLYALTRNFDIFELSLRRITQELQAVLPLIKNGQPISSLIEDPHGRDMWLTTFADDPVIVEYYQFMAMLIESKVLAGMSLIEENKITLSLRYLLDYPHFGMVTTYKWAWLLRVFGPTVNDLRHNLLLVSIQTGFAGLMNRIEAYEKLSRGQQRRTFIIRLSRTEPEFLAFSYINSDGHIGHQINKHPDTNKVIPIGEFLQLKFGQYEPYPVRLNINMLFELSPCQLALTNCDYCTI